MRESALERKDRGRAKADGWFVEKVMKTGRNGFPDRFYAKGGRVVLMEWKRPGGVLSPQQELRIAELRAAGVEVYVVDNLEDAAAIRAGTYL